MKNPDKKVNQYMDSRCKKAIFRKEGGQGGRGGGGGVNHLYMNNNRNQKHITPKRITLSQSSGFLGNQSKFTS